MKNIWNKCDTDRHLARTYDKTYDHNMKFMWTYSENHEFDDSHTMFITCSYFMIKWSHNTCARFFQKIACRFCTKCESSLRLFPAGFSRNANESSWLPYELEIEIIETDIWLCRKEYWIQPYCPSPPSTYLMWCGPMAAGVWRSRPWSWWRSAASISDQIVFLFSASLIERGRLKPILRNITMKAFPTILTLSSRPWAIKILVCT